MTVNGAVPVATLLINWGAVTFAVARTCVVPKFPTFALPDTPNVPVTFAPVAVAMILAPPTALIVTLAFAVIVTLLLPFCSSPLLIVVILPVVAINVVVPKLPVFALPVTFNNVTERFPVAALNEILALEPNA